MSARKASTADISVVAARVCSSAALQFPSLVIDSNRIEELAARCVSAGNAIALISDSGVLLAMECPYIAFERNYTSIAILLADTVLECEELVARLLQWVEPRKGSSMVGYASAITTNADEALINSGFSQAGTMLVRWRYK